jgi:dipeptidyl aminopeptidase/acylaminoacyl peptidase
MWSNGGGFTSDTRGALFLRSSDGSITRLTPDYCGVEDFAVAADASVILFTGLEYRGKREARNDLYRVDLTGFDPTSTAPGQAPRTKLSDDLPRQYGRPVFMDGNRALLSVNRMERYGLNENPDLALLDLSAGTLRFVTEGMDRSLGNSVNSDCRFAAGSPPRFHKGRLVFVSTEGETSGLRSFDPESGAIRDLYVPQGSIDAFDLRGEQALVVELRPDALQELYQLPIETDAEAEAERPAAAAAAGPVRLSSFNVANLVSKRFRTPEPLSVSREDGTEITGYVLSPPETASASSASGRRPGILAIHGGPKTAYGSVFNHEMQVLAAEGYYVFFCNPRGSDGRGNAFADIRGRYGTVDYEDLMAFTDAVLQRYVDRIDDTRLGVMGGSYGGFMTNWIVGNTERFAAGVSQRSISSWLSMWGTSDIGFFFTEDQIAGDPWEGREALWRQSPLRLAPQVKTPVLLIHSRQDYRCWEVEAFQFFTAIRYHGGEAAIALFDGENHELSRSGKPKPRIRRLQEILDWFKVYLA